MGQPSDPWAHNTPTYGSPIAPQPGQPVGVAAPSVPRPGARLYNPRRRRRIAWTFAALAILVLVVAVVALACRPTTTPIPPPSSSASGEPSSTAMTTPAVSTPAAPTTPAIPEGYLAVPDGVGLDYQSAQDLWRDAGLHVLPAYDALGKWRLPIIDRHWEVVSQDPRAGEIVEKGSFIRATVKKFGEVVP